MVQTEGEYNTNIEKTAVNAKYRKFPVSRKFKRISFFDKKDKAEHSRALSYEDVLHLLLVSFIIAVLMIVAARHIWEWNDDLSRNLKGSKIDPFFVPLDHREVFVSSKKKETKPVPFFKLNEELSFPFGSLFSIDTNIDCSKFDLGIKGVTRSSAQKCSFSVEKEKIELFKEMVSFVGERKTLEQ